MINFVAAWIKDIVFIVLFSTFFELLLPNSSMQRFVRVIMGLLIMIAVLNPIIAIVHSNTTTNQVPTLALGKVHSTDLLSAANRTKNEREELTKKIYKNDLAKQVRALILAVDGVADAKVSVELKNGGVSHGSMIQQVIVYVKPGITQSNTNVNKVVIGKYHADEHQQNLEVRTQEKIRRIICELYSLRTDNVQVFAMN